MAAAGGPKGSICPWPRPEGIDFLRTSVRGSFHEGENELVVSNTNEPAVSLAGIAGLFFLMAAHSTREGERCTSFHHPNRRLECSGWTVAGRLARVGVGSLFFGPRSCTGEHRQRGDELQRHWPSSSAPKAFITSWMRGAFHSLPRRVVKPASFRAAATPAQLIPEARWRDASPITAA